MKINDQIVTTYDLEKERNYLLALNPKLREINENDLSKLAKRSLTKEMIRKSEILKYKELGLKNAQIDDVLSEIIQKLNFSDLNQFENYLINFNISIDDIKEKIEIENEWKSMIYAKYSKSIKIDKDDLINKIEKISKEESFLEYNLSEIVFSKKQNISLKEYSKKILESIKINGFENTANIYSISNSAKNGGLIGWINELQVSKIINENVNKLSIEDISEPIKIGNAYIIIKLNDKKEITSNIDINKELEKLINSERNRQLNNFSIVFYKRLKKNIEINEY